MKLWDLDYLNKKIIEFRDKSFDTESIDEVVKLLESFYNSYNITVSNIGKISAFRVRKLEYGKKHDTTKSLWAPPSEYVKQIGRANDIGESILYAAFDPLTAILEGRIREGDEFSLAIYYLEPKEDWDMTSVVISVPKIGIEQTKELDEYSISLSKFMVDEFTKEIEEGNEHEYKKSCAMAKTLLRLPYKDSIVYPSIQNADRVNIAMVEEKAKERMKLRSVLKCKLIRMNEDNTAQVEISSIAQANEGIDSLEYDPIPVDNYTISISYDTWVKKVLNFNDTFKPENISTPEEIMKDILSKKKE